MNNVKKQLTEKEAEDLVRDIAEKLKSTGLSFFLAVTDTVTGEEKPQRPSWERSRGVPLLVVSRCWTQCGWDWGSSSSRAHTRGWFPIRLLTATSGSVP